jgi:CspA family cold shock protein
LWFCRHSRPGSLGETWAISQRGQKLANTFISCCNGGAFLHSSRRQAMPKGTVKWFNPTKGYGFIKPNGSDKDVFVHISAVERAGLSTLNENQVVEYDLVENRGKASAENLKVS